MPSENETTSKQNIRDRYNGLNDPVASKMLSRVRGGATGSLVAPNDKNVVCVCIRLNGKNIDLTYCCCRLHYLLLASKKILAKKT